MKKILYSIFILLLLSGCANFYCSRYPNNNYAPTIAKNIPIYNSYPPNSYEVIGELGAGGAPLSSWNGIGKRLREYAAQIGGDAIVIQEQGTPYVGTYTTPTTATTTSSAHGSAYGSGNYVYGQAYGQSHTTINPGMSIPMYGKSVKAFVIKFNSSSETATSFSEHMVQDTKYGNISDKYFIYINNNSNSSKRGQADLSKIFSSYEKTKVYDKILQDKETAYTNERNIRVAEIKQIKDNADKNMKVTSLKEWDAQNQSALKQEQNDKMKEILKDIESVMVAFGNKNKYKAIYNDKMPGCNEQDVSNEMIFPRKSGHNEELVLA